VVVRNSADTFFGCQTGGSNPAHSQWGVYLKVSDDEFYCIDNGANFAKAFAEAEFEFDGGIVCNYYGS